MHNCSAHIYAHSKSNYNSFIFHSLFSLPSKTSFGEKYVDVKRVARGETAEQRDFIYEIIGREQSHKIIIYFNLLIIR